MLISVFALALYSFIFEPNNIQVEEISISIENLPESFDRVKIVHLTDFHSLGFNSREKKVISIVNSIEPDFIFITGDFIDTKTKDLVSCAEFWRNLSSEYKGRIFAVLGNHDIDSLEALLEQNNINVFNNESAKIFMDSEYVHLVGVNDPDTRRHNLDKAMAGARGDANVPKILLAHSPDILKDLRVGEYPDLILAGHTHGGQVKIPFIRPFWVPTDFRGKFASGLFEINSAFMYVNRGVGMTSLPVRFNCAPEIAVIELKKK